MNKIIDVVFNRVANYFKYVMCVFAFISILGVLIPTKVFGFSAGNYFSMGKNALSGGPARAIFIILSVLQSFSLPLRRMNLYQVLQQLY